MDRLRAPRTQHGAVAVLVALSLIVLMAFAGLVIDLGRLFVIKTELQNAADACALAAARELNVPSKTLAVLTRAENAGIEVGNRHFDDFQHDAVVFQTDHDVTFSPALDGQYVTKGSAATDVRYVRCTHQITGVIPTLLSLVGASRQDVVATGVASLQGGMTTCPVPLAMCAEKAPVPPCKSSSASPDAFGLCKGQWYPGGLGYAHVVGNWNWIDFTAHSGGASEVSAALAGPGVCEFDIDEKVHAEQGNMQSVDQAWNSRFGLYKNKYDMVSGVPDLTGYAYGSNNWPLGRDAYADFLSRRESFVKYPGDSTVGPKSEIDTHGFDNKATDHRSGADRRIVVMPVVDCTDWDSAHEVAVLGWACALMVQPWPPNKVQILLEYLGPTTADDSPCSSFGLSGGPGGVGPKVPTLVQ